LSGGVGSTRPGHSFRGAGAVSHYARNRPRQGAVTGYARHLGISGEKFLENMGPRQSPGDVADAVIALKVNPPSNPASIFVVSAGGVAATV